MKKGPVFPKPVIEASKLGEPGRGHASDAKRIGTRTKRGLGVFSSVAADFALRLGPNNERSGQINCKHD